MSLLFPQPVVDLMRLVADHARTQRCAVFVVGGTIRDLFLEAGNVDKDIDFIVEGDSAAFATQIAEKLNAEVRTFPQFLTAKVERISGYGVLKEIDFVATRSEQYSRGGALPSVQRGTLHDDIARRDFSINTLAVALDDLITSDSLVALKEKVIDRCGGLHDLERRIVRTLHAGSFWDDPTRIFRGCRYLTRINGSFASETEQQLRDAIAQGVLASISPTRKLNELRKIVAETTGARTIALLLAYKVFSETPIFSEERLPSFMPSLERLCSSEVRAGDDLRFAAALRIFFESFEPHDRQARFEAWQFGKRQRKSIEYDLTFQGDPRQLDEAGMLYYWATGKASSSRANLGALLSTKGLLA